MANFEYHFGYTIVKSREAVDRVQARKHKAKRINKKWRKRHGFREYPKKMAYIIGNQVIVHPDTWDKIKKTLHIRG